MDSMIESKIGKFNITFDYKFFIYLLTEKFSHNENIDKIYLFGSCATGKVTNKSDIDLAIIVNDKIPADRNFRLNIISKIEDMLMERESITNIPYDVVFFNCADFERNKGISISVVNDIEQKGKVLYER